MTIGAWLELAIKKLQNNNATARLDAEVLLADAFGKDRAWLLAHPEAIISPLVLRTLSRQLKRRQQHEPLAYIRGKSEFYGREFRVTAATLQPRPETETMIDLFKLLKGNELRTLGKIHVADIGTGSGCLAITTRLELPDTAVFATEINPKALKVAQQNAELLRAQVNFYKGNLIEPLKTILPFPSPLVILANLPYVPDTHTINKAAMQEPKVAIFGGPDGLDLYRQLFKQIEQLIQKPNFILTESLPPQHKELAAIAATAGYSLERSQDFIQVFRTT